MGDHEQTGVAACYSVDEYDRGLIKKHEKTRPDKEDDRTRHILDAARADRAGVPDLPRLGRGRRGRRGGSPRRAALRLHRRRRRAAHVWRVTGADAARRSSAAFARRARALHRRRPPPRGQRRARPRPLGRGGSPGECGHASSPWRSPTARCRSCRTTAS